ncbi:unnamed protein product, partial [Ectocarpus fasciculatus]
ARVRDRPPYTCLTKFPKPINWQVGDVIIASKKSSSGTRWHDSRRRRLIFRNSADAETGGVGIEARYSSASVLQPVCPRGLRYPTVACFLCPMLIGHEAPDCVCSTTREEASP